MFDIGDTISAEGYPSLTITEIYLTKRGDVYLGCGDRAAKIHENDARLIEKTTSPQPFHVGDYVHIGDWNSIKNGFPRIAVNEMMEYENTDGIITHIVPWELDRYGLKLDTGGGWWYPMTCITPAKEMPDITNEQLDTILGF